jgi:hypothetical protein
MKIFRNIIAGAVLAGSLMSSNLYAGNPDRAGQAGATQLLINPWARSSGMGGANMAGVSGVEALSLNVAGLSNIRQTEFLFGRTNWLGGLGVNINSFGFAQKLGSDKESTIGLSVTSFDFGKVPLTTENQPEGAGTYSIQMLNLAFGYAYTFSENISGGVLVRAVSEGVPNATSQGLSLDAGIQYKAGKNDRSRFGVTLRNVGPALQFSGDGLSARGILDGYDHSLTLEKRTSSYEMPSVLSISAAYDLITQDSAGKGNVLTLAGAYVSNAFSKDQFALGLQWAPLRYISIRAGFVYEKGIFSSENQTSSFSGPSGGVSLNIPFGKDKLRKFGVDYSFRATNKFSGTHSIGVRVNL